MNPGDETSYGAVFTAAVRPGRAVYLIGEGSTSGFRRAVQEASTRWAGACEVIVEIRPDGSMSDEHRRAVELSGPDGAVNVDAPQDASTMAASTLGLDLISIDQIDSDGWTSFSCPPAWLGQPPTVDGSNGHVIASADGSLWEVAAAGDLSAERESELRWDTLAIRRPSSTGEIGQAQLWQHTLLDRTVAHFSEHTATGGVSDGPTILWLTSEGGELADCLGFWNVRALRPLRFGTVPMYLLPATGLKDWVGFPEQLADQLRRPEEISLDVLVASRTLGPEVLDEVAEYFGLEESAETDFQAVVRFPPGDRMRTAPFSYRKSMGTTRFSAFTRTYGETTQVDVPVVREKITLRFPSPVPFTAWVDVLVGVTCEPFAAFPKRDSVAKLVDKKARWRNEAIEVATSMRREVRIELNVPTLATVANTLLVEQAERHETSEKGAVGVGLMDETSMAALGEAGVLETIQKLTTPRTSHMVRALERLRGKEDPLSDAEREFAARWGGRSERVFKSAAKLGHGTVEAASAALERLADVGWAERGLEIKCGACGITTFLPLSGVPERGAARCPGCGTLGGYTGAGQGPSLVYRLDSRIDRASDQGVLPHLLTIAALQRRYTRSWFLPGVDLWFPGKTNKMEADLFGIADAKVITGEVKASGEEFTKPGQIEKDVSIAVNLGADLYVMAAITTIPEAAQEAAKVLCQEHGVDILVLGPMELRAQTSGRASAS
ncbi:hypothetical protein OG689_44085 [Kitasatospora sp. NBC_00240]|uniref:hypothetical protein n=1 Tax=Kitasatospora sp. NBC_00240 TaxID=2903567 RepID=UPI00224CD3CF|nr:hypothetical protein [Kitasatospora sp. NBC_00240]MCX5216117.1 hypothetical protein [Kitasatospora sp. NBC_00240]